MLSSTKYKRDYYSLEYEYSCFHACSVYARLYSLIQFQLNTSRGKQTKRIGNSRVVNLGKKIERFECEDLRAVRIKSRSPKIEVSAPIIIVVEEIYVVAIAIIGLGGDALRWVDLVI